MDNNIENESRKSNTKTDTCMVSSNVHYNADTTCFTGAVLFSMCDTSMDSDIQVIYV
jgi:hypothetical protein